MASGIPVINKDPMMEAGPSSPRRSNASNLIKVDIQDVQLTSVPTPSMSEPPTAPLSSLRPQSSYVAAPAFTPFKPPPNPSIPQDLSVIADYVAAGQVVGHMPTISMSAAEKRKQVEASIKAKMEALQQKTITLKEGSEVASGLEKEKGKGKEKEMGMDVEDNDTDWSSEYESDEEVDRSLDNPIPNLDSDEVIKKELDEFVGASNETAEGSDSSDSEDSELDSNESDDEEEDQQEAGGEVEFEFSSSPLPSPNLKASLKPRMMIIEDEDEGTGGPIMSLNEVELPPVPLPKFDKLPEGEKLNLAGEVVSWMREKKVELWWEKQQQSEVTEIKKPIEKTVEHVMESVGNEVHPETTAAVEAGEVERASSINTELKENLPEVLVPGQSSLAPEEPESQTQDEIQEVSESANTGDGLKINTEDQNGNPMVVPSTTTEEEGEIVSPLKEPAPVLENYVEESSRSKPCQSNMPRFSSSGTVVVRAILQNPSTEGWLEEGSIVCFPDGRVLGYVSDTFGPLTSPYYTIRLPPPPFPYPTSSSLTPGCRLSYPQNARYRSYVNMQSVRDPRFKGSDASNIHDEEIGEDEIEWSDDELEAEAKKRRKNRGRSHLSDFNQSSDRSDRGPNNYSGSSKGMGIGGTAPGGVRNHFDYQPSEGDDDMASLYDLEDDQLDNISESGSNFSKRDKIVYDLNEGEVPDSPGTVISRLERSERDNQQGGARGQGRSRGGGRGRGGGQRNEAGRSDLRGRGRGGGHRGDDRGRGGRGGRGRGGTDRGGDRDNDRGRGGGRRGRERDDRQPGFQRQTNQDYQQQPYQSQTQSYGLPAKPTFDIDSNNHNIQPHPSPQSYQPFNYGAPPSPLPTPPMEYSPQASGMHFPPTPPQYHHQSHSQSQYQPPPQSSGQYHPQQPYQSQSAYLPNTYTSQQNMQHTNQPSPMMQNQNFAPMPPAGSTGTGGQGQNAPAINPRFAAMAQFQQMQMGMGANGMYQPMGWQNGQPR